MCSVSFCDVPVAVIHLLRFLCIYFAAVLYLFALLCIWCMCRCIDTVSICMYLLCSYLEMSTFYLGKWGDRIRLLKKMLLKKMLLKKDAVKNDIPDGRKSFSSVRKYHTDPLQHSLKAPQGSSPLSELLSLEEPWGTVGKVSLVSVSIIRIH